MAEPHLLDRVRDALRMRYRIRIEQCYVQWIKRCILFHGKCHPDERGAQGWLLSCRIWFGARMLRR